MCVHASLICCYPQRARSLLQVCGCPPAAARIAGCAAAAANRSAPAARTPCRCVLRARAHARASIGVFIRLVLMCLILVRRGLCSSSIPTELAARQTSPRAVDGWRGTARSELPYDDVALSLPSLLICSRPRSNWLTAAVALQNGWGVCLEQDVVRSHRLVERQYGWQERDRQVRIALG